MYHVVIDWRKVWKEVDEWFDGQGIHSWTAQKRKIKQLVEKHSKAVPKGSQHD
jgi:hypothetical protein